MAYQLPDGTKLFLGTTFGSAVTVSAISNANPAVATATAHGFADNDVIILKSGWQKANERVFRVGGSVTNAFNLTGLDASSTSLYPAGAGAGTATKVTAFVQIAQVLGLATTGGEQQFATVSPLESDFEIQLPSITSAQSLTLTIGDDPTLAGYIALKAAAETRAIRPLELRSPSGASAFYYGYVSFNETPNLTKGQAATVTATFSLLSRPVRYA